MKARKLFAAAGVAFLLAIAVAIIDTAVLGHTSSDYESVFECVGEDEPSSGFVDGSQGDCPISIESYNEYRDLVTQTTPLQFVGRSLALIALLLLAAGTILGIVNIVRSRRGSPDKSDEAHV